jgi:hypothetical protein
MCNMTQLQYHKINCLMLFKKIITLYTENHAKPKYILGKMQSYLMLKQAVHIVTIGFKGLN